MTSPKSKGSCAIVGAGISGIQAALALEASEFEKIFLIEKSRSVGGRLATRRVDQSYFDHGAQFFTSRHPDFQPLVSSLLSEKKIFPWFGKSIDGSCSPFDLTTPAKDRCYAFSKYGINGLAKYLADQLRTTQILLETRVEDRGISLFREADERGTCEFFLKISQTQDLLVNKVLITAPLPQAMALLDMDLQNSVTLEEPSFQNFSYNKALVLLLTIDSNLISRFRSKLKGLVGINPFDFPIFKPLNHVERIVDNYAKGMSPNPGALSVYMDSTWSEDYFDKDDDLILASAEKILDLPLSNLAREYAQVKRWRYDSPKQVFKQRYFQSTKYPGLFFAGEAFGGPRVEGAFLSGKAAGQAITTFS